MQAGLQVSHNRTVINGFSLQRSKLENILPLAKKYDSDIIGYLLYPNGHVPHDLHDRLNIAVELYDELQRAGIDKERLIIDPIVAPLMWRKSAPEWWIVDGAATPNHTSLRS